MELFFFFSFLKDDGKRLRNLKKKEKKAFSCFFFSLSFFLSLFFLSLSFSELFFLQIYFYLNFARLEHAL